MTRTFKRVLGLCTFALLGVIRGCSQSDFGGSDPSQSVFSLSVPSLPDSADRLRQQACAEQVVINLIRRDGLEPYVLVEEVYLEPRNRMRVFFHFRQDMRSTFGRLGRFVKYPRWLGGGRYASTYGRGQPGFEIHLDQEDPTFTVRLDAHKSSDVDQHEPAGDIASVVMHGINLLQHAAGQPEVRPCDLLGHFEEQWRNIPRTAALEWRGDVMFVADESGSFQEGSPWMMRYLNENACLDSKK